MALLVASCSLFSASLILLLFRSRIQRESVKRRWLKSIRASRRFVDEELEKNILQRVLLPALKKLSERIAKLCKTRKARGRKSAREEKLEQELRLAGFLMSANDFNALRLLFMAGMLAAGALAAFLKIKDPMLRVLALVFSVGLAVLVPRYALKARIKSRQRAIQNQMPNVMDVLSVSIEAGLGFDSALLNVVRRFKGPLIRELHQVYREVQMGKPRREAMAALGQRSNVAELQTFASAVVQSEQFGTPIKNVLRSQAQQLRVSRRQKAEEKGMKAPVKMMLPMVLFIFPVIFIILLGPTVINIIK